MSLCHRPPDLVKCLLMRGYLAIAALQFDTVDPQTRRCEAAKTVYWAKPDYTIFTVGIGYWF